MEVLVILQLIEDLQLQAGQWIIAMEEQNQLVIMTIQLPGEEGFLLQLQTQL